MTYLARLRASKASSLVTARTDRTSAAHAQESAHDAGLSAPYADSNQESVFQKPADLCPCLTVWRVPGSPNRWVLTGSEHDIRSLYPGAYRAVLGQSRRCTMDEGN